MKLSELADHIGARYSEDEPVEINGIATLAEAGPGDLSFLSELRYANQAASTRAAAVIVPEDFQSDSVTPLLRVRDVNCALAQLLSLFAPPPDRPAAGIHPSACLAESVQLGNNLAIGPQVTIADGVNIADDSIINAGCYIGAQVKIGRHCFLGPNVVINARCELGDNVIIHANTTIGTDGFGYRLVDGKHQKFPHIGIVVIEDDVEIGSNSCVDRAKFGKTVIGKGTKIDNLVQVAHNVRIGEHCIIVSQTGIAGSSRLGKYVVLAGQCGISDHVTVGDGVMAGAQCAIARDVEPGARVIGSPYRPVRAFFREVSLIEKLPEMAKEIKKLRRQLDNLGNTKDHS